MVEMRPSPCSALRTPKLMGTFLGGSPPSSSFTSSFVFANHPPQLQLYLPRKPAFRSTSSLCWAGNCHQACAQGQCLATNSSKSGPNAHDRV